MKFIDKETIKKLNHAVFSSPDLESSINELFLFFRKYFSLDFMNFPFYSSKNGTLRYRAFVTDDGVILVDDTVRLTELANQAVLRILSERITNINDTQQNVIMQEIAAHLGIKERASTLFVKAEIGPSTYGVLGLVAYGQNMYKENHLRLLDEIYESSLALLRHICSRLEIASIKESLLTQNDALRKRIGYRIVGSGTGLKHVMDLVEQAAPLDIPILLEGETGVGKEVVANTIHRRSRRAEGPLIAINCGAIAESLMDSELFGHERGAFTGATSMKRGYFEQADKGTLFFDEISEMSPQAQMKLLRVLQTMTFQRVGGQRFISVNVRVIAASNRELPRMIEDNQFRKDLWFRLGAYPIRIPPLRERKEDIPMLAEYFARRKSTEMNLPCDYSFAPEAMEQLQNYDWPGNVREIQNVIERALIICRGAPVSFPYLKSEVENHKQSALRSVSGRFPTLEEMETAHIRQGIELAKGRIEGEGGAAQLLGIKPSTLRGRMKKRDIRIKKIL